MRKIAVTGHRPNKLYGYNLKNEKWISLGFQMRNFLKDRLNMYNEIECITGMALGVDQLFGLVALKLKKENYNVKICSAIPCRGQELKWPNKDYWQRIYDNADEIIYVHDGPYTNTCMQERNIFMVDRADEILAVWNGTSGGTKNCIDYAKKQNKIITNIYNKV